MIQLHPNFLTQNGEKVFAVLPYEEYLLIQEILEDIEDLNALRQAKAEEKDAPTLTLAALKEQLNRAE
ncbi:MAG: type II toxin-antitoxin system Phd/YefM family antitoxin [Symploca sp. SIO1B1]|nr:type II toxin-antitoxin system Phd/YefM family antitoxin [Symploca sp. SIO1B1]